MRIFRPLLTKLLPLTLMLLYLLFSTVRSMTISCVFAGGRATQPCRLRSRWSRNKWHPWALAAGRIAGKLGGNSEKFLAIGTNGRPTKVRVRRLQILRAFLRSHPSDRISAVGARFRRGARTNVTVARDPTFLGRVASVAGGSVTVRLAESLASGLAIVGAQTYQVAQVRELGRNSSWVSGSLWDRDRSGRHCAIGDRMSRPLSHCGG